MLDTATLTDSLALRTDVPVQSGRITALATTSIAAVEATWTRLLYSSDIESPGQSPAFIRLWARTQKISAEDCLFIIGEVDGVPVAILPLKRERRFGVLRLLRWMPGPHVGSNAPVVDVARLSALSPAVRRDLWARMLETVSEGDIVYLGHVPELSHFAELGTHMPADTLYRAQFDTWESANTIQRNKSRRKHDRQQGERLDALGSVTFDELRNGDDVRPVLDVMFRQRAARFAAMGVKDPFAPTRIRDFYYEAAGPGSEVSVRLHVLRLDGEIVAVRYNIVNGSRMFCLISSMSDEPSIQTGSPGKQCLLRVMQTVFDAGTSVFDMGTGFTDEKRHWCNVQIPVHQHYLPLTPVGALAAFVHRSWHTARRRIKDQPRMLALAKKVRAALNRTRLRPLREAGPSDT